MTFKLDNNSREFFKRIENLWEKGDIARNEQCLLFPRVLRDMYDRYVKTRAKFGKGLKTDIMNLLFCINPFPHNDTFYENTVGKGENARKTQFLLFPKCFLFYPFGEHLAIFIKLEIVRKLFQFEKSEMCCLGKG